MDEELELNEIQIDTEVEGVDNVSVRRTVPRLLGELVAEFGQKECIYMLRDTIRSRLQRKAGSLIRAIAKGRTEEGLESVADVHNYMCSWNPPGAMPQTKNEKLVSQLELVMSTLTDEQKKSIVGALKKSAKKA